MSRVRRIDLPDNLNTSLTSVDYHDTFTVQVDDGASGSAERWMREVFEAAPAPVRMFLRIGWSMFGARLGPWATTPTHLAGWRIEENLPDRIRLVVDWTVGLRANLVLRTETSTEASAITLATFVQHHRRASRILWPALVPVHHLTLRYLLARATR
ncbi:DUF2867 domain-containing protein [Amycolatopsis taiwanensis]|uniref:DUF2867 domain-containing protein n=1 Tax=Amycolatopsis taiwanensis TaxID=342230 RepID=A0A9W6VJ09_9PSEU|nr:DUF2867 domain-containing protein [Amycolatopsis taiwanensis]GLY68992.1 hypothetical protein Atai01_56110 [Amycolatopsis taiwanensis]